MKVVMRENKGLSLIDFPDDYVVIDLETSGYDVNHDSIIEVGALRIKNNEIIDSFNTFVKPKGFVDYDYINELTGIRKSDLEDAPAFDDIFESFQSFIGDDVLIGHNVNFDINFLYDNSYGKLTNNFIDTLRLSRKLLPELSHHRLIDLITYYSIELNMNLHRSIADCTYTFDVYNKIKKSIQEKYNDYDEFKSLFKRKRQNNVKHLDARDIKPTTFEFDIDNLLYDKYVVFTGALEKMKRADAMQIVTNIGGHCQNGVTKQTNYLILGNNDYCSTIKDGKSSKQKKAEKLKLEGNDIEIISENVFYELISE